MRTSIRSFRPLKTSITSRSSLPTLQIRTLWSKTDKAAEKPAEKPAQSSADAAPKKGDIKIDFKVPHDLYKCESIGAPNNYAYTNKEELIKFFTEMSRIRRMETIADQFYKQKLIRGFCHLYNGQEAVAAGIEAAIKKSDQIITAYRDHGLMVTRGSDPKSVLAELTMKATGCSRGKGGSMHMFDFNNHFYGGHGIVGAQVPLGTGLAFANQFTKNGNISLSFFGDGAANQGQIYEVFNMAALWKLPSLFVCENNQYAMGTSIGRSAADNTYYTRGHYIPGIRVDGMNVLAVREATRFAAEHARSGKGPMVLEMNTYRYVGHSMSDPGTTYRTRDEVSAMRADRDPIDRVRKWLLEYKFATEEDLTQIEKDIKKEMEDAAEYAKSGPFPDAKELYTDVYIEKVPVRAVELSQSYKP